MHGQRKLNVKLLLRLKIFHYWTSDLDNIQDKNLLHVNVDSFEEKLVKYLYLFKGFHLTPFWPTFEIHQPPQLV